jgi:cytochrome c oxidase subunit 5a
MSFFRVAARAVRAPAQPRIQVASRIQRLNQARTFSVASVKRADVDAHDPHHEESFEEFTARCVHLPVHISLFSHSPGTHSTV